MTRELLAKHLPSISWMKVVEHSPGGYTAFEGNGRLAAMQEVFSPADGIKVEVEQYHFRNPAKIVRRLNRCNDRTVSFQHEERSTAAEGADGSPDCEPGRRWRVSSEGLARKATMNDSYTGLSDR